MSREEGGGTGEGSVEQEGNVLNDQERAVSGRETRNQALCMGSPHLPTGDPAISPQSQTVWLEHICPWVVLELDKHSLTRSSPNSTSRLFLTLPGPFQACAIREEKPTFTEQKAIWQRKWKLSLPSWGLHLSMSVAQSLWSLLSACRLGNDTEGKQWWMTGVQLSMDHVTSLLGEIGNLTLKDVWLLVLPNRATLNKIMK